MSKILAISDIHIFDYPQRNSYDKQRLTQARTVAQNIIKAATIEGAERVVINLLNTWRTNPAEWGKEVLSSNS